MSGKGPQLPRVKGNISKPKEGQCVESEGMCAGKPLEKKVKSSLQAHLTLPMTVLMGAVADMVCKLNFGNRIPF